MKLSYEDLFITYLTTARNSIIDTASFTTPSPNSIEFNTGYSSFLIIANAATESVAHRIAAKIIHSYTYILSWLYSPKYYSFA